MDKNDRKFNLPGRLTAGGFSLPATITARIGQSGARLCQTLQNLRLGQYLTKKYIFRSLTDVGGPLS